jgi:GT2 family glycosyltransferase
VEEPLVPQATGGEEYPFSVSVVVASHARHLRLRWLLNALEEQTLAPDRWEVVVVHDYDSDTAERVLERHPLREAGRLRHLPIPPGTGSPGRQRNLGWRRARGELIAFTDDDCRPESDWLERLLQEAARHPGQVVQGATRPDGHELDVLRAPHVRTLLVKPVGPYAQACNIVYPRSLLERLDGFDERAIAGEDVGLSLRARAAGVDIVAAEGAIVNHAIESHTLPGIMGQNLKWRHLAYLAKRHPEFRSEFPLRIFWDGDHLRVTAAFAGLVGARRHWSLLVLTAPYVARCMDRRGRGRRARAVALAELPGAAARQFAEVLGLAAGSLRHRTLLL